MTGTAHHIVVSRSARYVTLGPLDRTVSQVWLACHGYGQLAAEFARPLAVLDDGTRLIVVPEGLSRFYLDNPHRTVGASWMTREARAGEIEDYIAYLDAVWAEAAASAIGAETTVHLLGFSQGVATVCRWAARGLVRPTRLVLWANDVPPDLDWAAAEPRLRQVEVVLVCGRDDPFLKSGRLAADEALLTQHGVRHRRVDFDGGHQLARAVLTELAGSD